jgi:predicted RNase H-like HicB family nuclease
MKFTLDYWIDDGWFVGKLLEVPGIFSQGQTLEELMNNIKEVYQLMMEEYSLSSINYKESKQLELVI